MGVNKPTTWNGKHYWSRTDAAKACGISQPCMSNRIKRGYKSDEDMVRKGLVRPSGYNEVCMWNGIAYLSISDAAEANDMSFSCMRTFLRKGYTCDDDIGKFGDKNPIVWNGIKYRTIKAAAIANGVEHSVIRYRIDNGYTSDKDVKYRRMVSWNGIEYATLTIAAKALGISHQALSQRLIKGYTCDADMGR